MVIQFGRSKKTTAEQLVLKEPDYVLRLLRATGDNPKFLEALEELRRLVARFDQKPILKQCEGRCDNPATYCSGYMGSTELRFWCEVCDPALFGAWSAKLVPIRCYCDALDFADLYCTKSAMPILIKTIGIAKGLSEPVGKEQAKAFFAV